MAPLACRGPSGSRARCARGARRSPASRAGRRRRRRARRSDLISESATTSGVAWRACKRPRSRKTLPNLFPRLAEGAAGSNVLIEIIQAAVQLEPLGLRKRHIGGILAKPILDPLQEVKLFFSAEVVEVDGGVAHRSDSASTHEDAAMRSTRHSYRGWRSPERTSMTAAARGPRPPKRAATSASVRAAAPRSAAQLQQRRPGVPVVVARAAHRRGFDAQQRRRPGRGENPGAPGVERERPDGRLISRPSER